MRNHRRFALLLGFGLLLALTGAAVAFRPWFWPGSKPAGLEAAQQRVDGLEQEVERARATVRDGANAYAPAMYRRLDDLSATAAEILRQLPSVVDGEVLVTCPKPARRIIHLRDWHHVPRDLYAMDLQHVAGKPRSEAELDLLHRELLLQVELVSIEHEALLTLLVKHHGLRRVLCEGLTQDGLQQFRDVIGELREANRGIAKLQQQMAGLKGEVEAIDNDLAELQRWHRQQLLVYGAVGRLAIDEAIEVLPLDDEQLLEAAKPIRRDGTRKLDPTTLGARHDGQVQAALVAGPVSLLVLGASHDLSAAVRRLGGGDTEYIRVTTATVGRFVARSDP